MRIKSGIKTMRTVCGKTISYLQEEGKTPRMHSITGPAITYFEEGKAPEYYLYGIKYSKQRWKELLSQRKTPAIVDMSSFDPQNSTIY